MCGGSRGAASSTRTMTGLSPRVRGKPLYRPGEAVERRSIPACAGEASSASLVMRHRVVYPRVCGGSCGGIWTNMRGWGLSPRVRGKPPRRGNQPPPTRSIPACAGEALLVIGRHPDAGVYPRVCGGSVAAGRERRQQLGLSPRVRGKLARCIPRTDAERSIPACAGEALVCRPPSLHGEVYPRVCGGSYSSYPGLPLAYGLSPRVRGKQRYRRPPAAGRQSIPACAGEATLPEVPAPSKRVYPRVCGGSWDEKFGNVAHPGLSPRVRGKRADCPGRAVGVGSIPACAGEAALSGGCRWGSVVYPRVCGGSRIVLPPRGE